MGRYLSRQPSWLVGALVVLLVGSLALLLSSLHAFRTLATSDEFVYAVMGRNIATGRGAVSGYYDTASILHSGLPLGDVHMPGYAFVLAASFLLCGETISATLAPGVVAFLLTGLLLFALGRRLFDDRVGVTAAILFFAFPGMASWAHTPTPEVLLVLLAAAYAHAWCRTLQEPHPLDPVLLASLLWLGVTVRETFLVLLPTAVYALWRRPAASRLRGLAGFGVAVTAYALLLLPMVRARAPYPNFFVEILQQPDLRGIGSIVWANVDHCLRGLPQLGANPTGWTFGAILSIGLVVPLVSLRGAGPLRWISGFVLFATAGTLVALVGFYPLRDRFFADTLATRPATWGAGIRALLFVCAPATVVLAATLHRIRPLGARACALAAALLATSIVGYRYNEALVAARTSAYNFDAPLSHLVTAASAPYQPRTVLVEGAFLYGWRAYPVNVIWRATARAEEIGALERVVPLDLIFVGEERRSELETAVHSGMLRGGYQTVAQPARGVFMLASAECRNRSQIHPESEPRDD